MIRKTYLPKTPITTGKYKDSPILGYCKNHHLSASDSRAEKKPGKNMMPKWGLFYVNIGGSWLRLAWFVSRLVLRWKWPLALR